MEFQLIESFPNNNPSYSTEDSQILFPSEVNSLFSSNSYIELHYYNGDSLLNSNLNYSFYSPLSPIEIDNSIYYREISLDLNSELLDLPSYLPSNIVFNFFTKKIGSNLEPLFISEISSDRTEIRLDSTSLSDIDLSDQASKFIAERNNSPYFVDFYINLGENKVFIANNLQLDSTDPNNITLLVKLYEPLPTDVNLNTILWVVIPALPSKAYSVEVIPAVFSVSNPTTRIKGPNFNIDLKDQVNNSTQELSYVDLITTSLTSSQNQLNSLLEEKEIDINIDYTNFEDFIHFSSAQTRLENFYYKASLLEQYSSSIYILDNATSSSVALSQSKAVYEAKINEIITNFDGWDYYLYYSSGSQAWPKLNNEPPYQIAPTGSIAVINWFGSLNEASPQYGGIILSASLYDESNKDNLLFSIPEYLRDNSSNESYILFIDMVAQHYDNIWVYYKDVTNLYNADNRLEYGISKDIVADAIRDFGVKLYQNNFSNQDLYTAFLGLTPEGGLFPFPNITGSLPTPSGLEYVDILVSASNDYIPLDDVNKSLYKRIYHNLPYLLKSRGTLPGLRALITSYGIPDTVLRINEYGGKDKVDSNDWDYWQNEFNYKFTPNNSYISSSWALNPAWGSPNNVPATLMFRFQSNELPTSSIPYSQSLWANNLGSTLTLRYTGSAYTSGSYSGSIKDPYYQYAHLDFYPDKAQPTIFSSIYLPFFDNGWWSVMINRSASVFTLSAANKIYEGGDNGTVLGFYTSSLVSGSSTPWVNSTKSYFPSSSFSGSYQEIRYYSTVIAADIFKDYTMNPYSIEGNSLNDSSNELAFRASLGGELYTGSKSIHPKVTGSWATTHSFASTSNFYFSSTPNFVINREYFFYDQPIAGIKNAVSDKIRLENDNIPTGNTLSPFRSLAQTTEASASYTAGTNLLEVAFSPQNEINDDINSSIGYFNIGNFIGDPAFRSSRLTSYPDLDQLRNEYFEKYTKNYNLVDFIRLIKFFDNSLFKMIRDFVPARTSLASGVVIKQTLLERNRYPEPQVDNHTTIAKYGRSGSIIWNEPIIVQDISVTGSVNPQWNDYNPGTIERFNGGAAGTFEQFNGINTSPYGADGNGPDNRFSITQSWTESYPSLSGSVLIIHSSQDEFYDGEFSGSIITVTTQSLNQAYPLNYSLYSYKPVHYYATSAAIEGASPFDDNDWLNYFLSSLTTPPSGEIYFYDKKIGSLYTTYIKVAKVDCNGNDNTNILENLTTLLVYNSVLNTYSEYQVNLFGEGPGFILYSCDNPLQVFNEASFPNQVLDYYSSASIPPSSYLPFGPAVSQISGFNTPIGNTLNYFDPLTGEYTFGNTPNTRTQASASIYVNIIPGATGPAKLSIVSEQLGLLDTINFDASSAPLTLNLSASFYSLNGDIIYLQKSGFSGGTMWVEEASFVITQSRPIEVVNCNPVAFFEPNITEANFYNSDENALINNAFEDRLSIQYQDVDYSTGALIPTNFDLLVSGSAQKAPVQDSNYSTLRHANPRYNGSRTTSQELNVWTEGDEGTYGKLPTIDSTKVYVAYCDNFTGFPPERMNTSALVVQYLIGEDGSIVIPSTSPYSLQTNKGTFESGERITISAQSSVQGLQEYYNIIRGGTRIEPILYTQIGHTPASWAPSMSFVSSLPVQDTSSYGDYQAKYSSLASVRANNNTFGTLPFETQISSGSEASWDVNRYVVTSNAVLDNIDLTLNGKIYANFVNNIGGNSPARVLYMTAVLVKDDGINPLTILDTHEQVYPFNSNNSSYQFIFNLNYTIPSSDLNAGDEYFIRFKQSAGNPPNDSYPGNFTLTISPASLFNITQYPTPTNFIVETTGSNKVWGYPDPINYPYIITSSHPVLVASYGDPYIKQENISGSGFNNIELPWSIKYGDEFRFEGNENQVYSVKTIYSPGSNDDRLFNSSSIEVHFNSILPVNSSPSIFNLDHFLIRRYVDDPSIILIEGLRPSGASGNGPWLIKPEFVTPSLNKSIDQFIVDLTERGLIT